MVFQVDFTRKAHRDIETQLAWWIRHGKAAAERWLSRFMERVVEALEINPRRYPQAEEAVDLGVDLRMMLYGKRRQVYRILFTIEGERVIVHRVRHASQDRLHEDDVF